MEILDTGIETYFITDEMKIEPFIDIAFIPIMLIDKNQNEIKILQREKIALPVHRVIYLLFAGQVLMIS